MRKIIACVLGLMLCVSEGYALPSRYDLRDYGRISSVKNQGIPGPCWAFAALGAMESYWLTQGLGKTPNFSEMHLAFYAYKGPDKRQTFTPLHSSGTLSLEGNSFRAAALLLRLAGPVDEKSLPYSTTLTDSQKKALAKKSPESWKRSARLRDVYFLAGDRTLNDAIKKGLIMQHGAIVVSIYSDPMKYHTRNGHYTYYNPTHGTDTDHVVLLAGWDDDFPRENFSPMPKKNGAWLVKNSWGTMRGSEGGYFWMSYEQHTWGGTAFVVGKDNPRLKHYGHDALGFCSALQYSWGANVFKAEGKRETLKEAAFYAPSNNLNYELRAYSLGMKTPNSPVGGKLIANTSGRIRLAGYYTITLPESVRLNEGEYFSVVLKFSGGYMPVETRVAGYSESAEVNANESYFSRDGRTWTDGVRLKANACIKAYTESR